MNFFFFSFSYSYFSFFFLFLTCLLFPEREREREGEGKKRIKTFLPGERCDQTIFLFPELTSSLVLFELVSSFFLPSFYFSLSLLAILNPTTSHLLYTSNIGSHLISCLFFSLSPLFSLFALPICDRQSVLYLQSTSLTNMKKGSFRNRKNQDEKREKKRKRKN